MEFQVPFRVFQLIESQISVSDLGMLCSLHANFSVDQVLMVPDSFQGVAKLVMGRNLKILSAAHLYQFTSLPIVPSNWGNLTSLASVSCLSPVGLVNILKSCPLLVQFTFATMERDLERLGALLNNECIPLLFLRSLQVIEDADGDVLHDLFSVIYTPQLKWISYRNLYLHDHLGPSITSLIRGSTALTKLTLHTPALTSRDVRHVLQSTRALTHLVLGVELGNDDGTLLRQDRSAYDSHLGCDFSEIFAKDAASSNLVGRLLSRLMKLEISNSFWMTITDDAVLNFVLGRIDPFDQSIAVLNHFSAIFHREKEKVIESVVHCHARLNGVVVTILLDYLYTPPERRYTDAYPGSWVGLKDGSTWLRQTTDYAYYEKVSSFDSL